MTVRATVQIATPAQLRSRLRHHRVELTGPTRHSVQGATAVVVHGGRGHWSVELSDGTQTSGTGPATVRALTVLAVEAVAGIVRDSGRAVSLLVSTLEYAPSLQVRRDLPQSLELLNWAPDIERQLATAAAELAMAQVTPEQHEQAAWDQNPHRIPPLPATNRVVVGTDASRGRNAARGVSWGWASENGFGDAGCTTKVRSINAAEIVAIARALEAIDWPTCVHFLSDSRAAVAAVRGLLNGHDAVSLGDRFPVDERASVVSALIAIHGRVREGRVTVEWVRGHNGNRLNEAADRLAVLARRLNDAGLQTETRARVRRVLAELRGSTDPKPAEAVLAA